ncbi:Ig-like domain-containing protein [Neobacillus mesonae]|uniref:Ig-like domain-containing protein n=1 Tax=Neobacillus mesonae TaxID=1193713 RepID=UPI00203C74A6|nr:Ig-like domain-containing protein [Neobacillus mesonae]MCM3568963.1 hypothetical protein [Neobacillus mesonae]
MKKYLIALLTLLVLGGAGFFIYSHINKGKAATSSALVTDVKTEKRTVNQNEMVDVRTDIPVDKVWEYSFGEALDEKSLTKENIYILDDKKQKVDINIQLTNDGTTILIHPPAGGYKKGTKFELNMKKDIKYTSGQNVSRHYKMEFVTIRDEVEKAVLNPKIKTLKKEQVEILGDRSLKIDKDAVKGPLAKNDIIIVPTAEYPEGQALKIKKVEKNFNHYTVSVGEPEFAELYQELNVYKTYPITSDNFTLAEGIEGVTVESLASIQPVQVVASETISKGNKAEFKEMDPGIKVRLDKGLKVKFDNFVLNKKYKLGIDGTMHLFSPKVTPDFKAGLMKIDRLGLTSKMKVDTNVKFKRMGKELSNGKKEIKNFSKKVKLGTIAIPVTAAPGLVIRGDLMLRVEVTAEGGPELLVTIEKEETSGVLYENGEIDHISKIKNDMDIGIQGRGKAEGKFGPSVDLLATAFGVVGVGVEGYAGAKITGEGAVGTNTKGGSFACGKIDYGAFAQASLVVNTPKTTLAELLIKEHSIGLGVTLNNCQSITGFAPVKQIEINSGASKEVKIESVQHDLLSMTDDNKATDMEKVKVSVTPKGIVQVKKTKDGLQVKAEELPSEEKAAITLTQKVKDKEYQLKIPVAIKNFKQIQEEQKAKGSTDAWVGEWLRTSEYSPGTLRITNFNEGVLDVSMEVYSGANTSGIDGKAAVNGNKAKLVDTEYDTGCQLDMTLHDDYIHIEETPGCGEIGGIGTSLAGDFKNPSAAANTKKATLSSLKIVNTTVDSDIKKLLGSDYDALVSNMQIVDTEAGAKYGLEDSVAIEGGVRGLYTLKEGIIVIDPFGHYYVGSIINDGEKVKQYTNDEDYQNKIHPVIDKWRQRFSDYPVEYVYKKIN